MKIIAKKQFKDLGVFMIVSGLGALWLTYWWYQAALGGSGTYGTSQFSSMSVFYYYLANSLVLLLSGLFLYAKRFKIFSILSLILGLMVTASLFVFSDFSVIANNQPIFKNLFAYTVFLGTFVAVSYGGVLVVPMFLYSVYKSFIFGTMFLNKRLDFSLTNSSEEESNITKKKGVLAEFIPIAGILIGISNIVFIMNFNFSFTASLKDSITSLIPILMIIFSFISLRSNRRRLYIISNIILVGLITFPSILLWIGKF